MREREWKPGDVAMVSGRDGETHRAIRAGESWSLDSDWSACLTDDLVTEARPLVVIDPEDREQVARLADAFCSARWSHQPGSEECDPLTRSSMKMALDDYLTPPTPPEPTGLGAVVEDTEGRRWVRVNAEPRPWRHDGYDFRPYESVAAVRVLSEGVS